MSKDIFITFDMDWASDEVLEYFYSLICELDIQGTLYVTHDSEMLDVFRKDDRLELGIHPNYNMLLEGMTENNTSYKNIIFDLMQIVPEAVSVRAHSLVSSSRLLNAYVMYGLKYDLNIIYPPQKNDHIKCFYSGEILRIPFIFEDDLYMMYHESDKKSILYYLGNGFVAPRVFNFHPIHLFLNSDNVGRYERARPYMNKFIELEKCINKDNKGMKDFLTELVDSAKRKGYIFKKIKDGNWEQKLIYR